MRRTDSPATPPAVTIAETLAAIRTTLDKRTTDAHTRALRAKADSFAHVLARWAAVPPTTAQQAALLELVEELRAAAESEAPRSSARPLGPIPLAKAKS